MLVGHVLAPLGVRASSVSALLLLNENRLRSYTHSRESHPVRKTIIRSKSLRSGFPRGFSHGKLRSIGVFVPREFRRQSVKGYRLHRTAKNSPVHKKGSVIRVVSMRRFRIPKQIAEL